MDEHGDSTGIEPICDLLVAWAGQGALVIEHMARHADHTSDDAAPLDVTFRHLVREVLGPMEDRHPAAHLAAAADVLLDAQRTLADEILLVDLAGSDREE